MCFLLLACQYHDDIKSAGLGNSPLVFGCFSEDGRYTSHAATNSLEQNMIFGCGLKQPKSFSRFTAHGLLNCENMQYMTVGLRSLQCLILIQISVWGFI